MHSRSTSAVSTRKNRKLSPPRGRPHVRNNFNQLHAQTTNTGGGNNNNNNSNNNNTKENNVAILNSNTNAKNNNNLEISSSFKYDYEQLKQIGSGTYGDIWKVQRKCDKKIFVLKNVPLTNLSKQQMKLAMGEVEAMKKICHPNIIQFHESCMEGRSINIIMEHAPYGDLSCMIVQAKNKGCYLQEKSLWEYLIQISEGLEYLHKEKILHRDIKAQNIFLDENLNIKIGDFGLVRMLGTHSVAAHSQVGTPLYFSPELCKEEAYDEKSDVWSFGCLMYEMAALHPPFQTKNQSVPALINKIVNMQPKALPDAFSDHLKFVILKMLDKDPSKRPSVSQILAYEPVQVRLPHSVFRREKENFRKQKKNFMQDLKIGQNAVNRIPKLERDIKAIKEEYENKIANLNSKLEKLKEEKIELNGKLEEKQILVNKQSGKIQHIFKENRSLKERVKNLEENNRLRAANEKKMKALYVETKRKLEEEVRFYQRQRSRPPTPKRSNSSGNLHGISNSGNNNNSSSHNSTNSSSSTPGSSNRKQLNRSISGEEEISPSQSPNPSPIPFLTKAYSPRTSRMNASTPPPSTHLQQSLHGINSGGSNRSSSSSNSRKSEEHSPTSSVSSNVSSTGKKSDRHKHSKKNKSKHQVGGGDLGLLKKKSKMKMTQATKLSHHYASSNNVTGSSNNDNNSKQQSRNAKEENEGRTTQSIGMNNVSKNIDDFIDNLNINNISIEMQRVLEDEGDFEPNDLDDDAKAKLIQNTVDIRENNTQVNVEKKLKNTETYDNEEKARSKVPKKYVSRVKLRRPLDKPTLSPPPPSHVKSDNNYNNNKNSKIVEKSSKRDPTERKNLHLNINKLQQVSVDFNNNNSSSKISNASLPKRMMDRRLATPSPQIVAPPSISRLSIEAMEENSNENMEKANVEEEYVEEETIKSSIIANDFTRSIPKLRSSSSSSGRHSSSSASTISNSATSPALSSSSCSFVSRKNFYTRRSFNVDHFDESPTMIRIDASNNGKMDTSPLQPKSLGNFSNHVDIVEENSPLQTSTTVRAVRMNDNTRSSLLLDQHPRIIDPEEEECETFDTKNIIVKNSVISRMQENIQQAPTPSQPTLLIASGKHSNRSTSSTFSSAMPKHSALSFKSKYFGLENRFNQQENETKEPRFSGLYRWTRVRHQDSNEPNTIKVRGTASGKVWRNGATFRLIKSTKQLFILYKTRNHKAIPGVKSFKVRCEKDGECDFKKVKFSSPVELSSKQTSLNDRWFMLENKKIKYSSSSSSGSSQQQRNRNISEIILEFDKEHVNLIETVVVLDFDTGFKDLVADAAASSPSTLLASKNVLDLHEEETIVQKAHNNHASRRRHQRSKKRKVESNENGIATPTAHFNRSQIAKLKARVQQLGYKSQKKV